MLTYTSQNLDERLTDVERQNAGRDEILRKLQAEVKDLREKKVDHEEFEAKFDEFDLLF